MGKKINLKTPNWIIVLIGAIVVMLGTATIGGLASAENPNPILTLKALFWLGIAREGVGFLYRAMKDNQLPEDDK